MDWFKGSIFTVISFGVFCKQKVYKLRNYIILFLTKNPIRNDDLNEFYNFIDPLAFYSFYNTF